MKRALVWVGSFCLSMCFIGCGSDQRSDLISRTVAMMDNAQAQLKLVKNNVNDAVKKAQQPGSTLDFTDAIKSTDALKKIGDTAQEIKRQQAALPPISKEEQEANAESSKQRIQESFKRLVQEEDELKKALDSTEPLAKANTQNATKVRELRDKLREALSPFETMARQPT